MARSLSNAALIQVDTDPTYKRVAKAIEEAIMSGRLKTGDTLPTETALAAQLGVNRSTVREGIRALENADLIKRGGGKRLVVRVPQASKIAWVNSRALGLMHVSFLDLWELQLQVEPFAASVAAERITPDLVQALRENVARLEGHLDDDERVIENDIEFHRLVGQAAGNAALSLVGEPIRVLLFSATVDLYETVPQARHRLLAAHRAILAEIEKGDSTAARRWMARHIEDFRRGYEVAGFDLRAPIPIDQRTQERFG
ncbi:MAG: FCD domain-containing protein [Paracoccus sp. (in: a-proteobacteria)]|uniref:FadR/GntR family transcriptional regulator n=1 Tax=Paracoccus sp. TaxID=267 RepID=UPI0039E266D5